MNPQPPHNFIAPIESSEKKFIDSIPEVANGADLWSDTDKGLSEIDLLQTNNDFWEQHNIKAASDFKANYRNGIHISHDAKINDLPMYGMLKGYIELLKAMFRNSDKSTQSVKYLLDVLETINDNIVHIIDKENIKIDNQHALASMHGFLIGIITSKTKVTNETRND